MPVAKTYAKMELSGEPFKESGRMYINVIAPKGLKKVRWYSDAEYARMYPEAKVSHNFNARYAFGFRDQGYITIFKGNEDDIRSWAQASWPPKAWYNTIFHFYTPGFMTLEHLPTSITPIRLTWDEVKIDDTMMKPYEEVEKYVLARIGDMVSSTSQFQGAKDEWILKELTVRENKAREDHFGEKHTHVMFDAEGNTYLWETGAKNYAVDTHVLLKMKVKEHKEIKGEKITVVWYCKEITL